LPFRNQLPAIAAKWLKIYEFLNNAVAAIRDKYTSKKKPA